MQRFLAIVASLVIVAVLSVSVMVPEAFSALQKVALSPGDTLTINCSTNLSGTPSGQSTTFTCATANPTSTPTRTPTPRIVRPTATPTPHIVH
jgi:hypothetical protein